MKIISWNLFHTKGATATQVRQMIEAHAPDLVLMQEATADIDVLPYTAGGFYARAALPGRAHGLAAWSAVPFESPAEILPLQRGLFVRRVCQIIEVGGMVFANVHLSHGQVLNRLQLRRIANALPKQAAILGDCNMVGAPLLQGFHDAGPRQATHNSARLIPLRLDRCFVRGLQCSARAVLESGASDHRPIMVTLTHPKS